jgi:taurine dioxygenase
MQALMSGELAFHSDLTYTRLPPEVLSLHALELPTTGGATRFANAALALRTLPDNLRTVIAGRLARHVYSFAEDYAGPRTPEAYAGRHFAADQPMVRRNPRTGRDVLFVADHSTQQVVGMEPAESARLLTTLFAHLYAPEHVYVHDWQPDDLVLWENLELQHSRADFDSRQRRILRRVIAGDPDSQRQHSAEVARQRSPAPPAEAVHV